MTDLRTAGFKQRTRVADARESLLDVPPIDRAERLSLSVADGRVVAEPIDAVRAFRTTPARRWTDGRSAPRTPSAHRIVLPQSFAPTRRSDRIEPSASTRE